MSVVEAVHTTSKVSSSSSSGFVLQRKCACGGSAGFTGDCEECMRTKLLGKALRRRRAADDPDDECEREADRVAEHVMRVSDPAPKPVRSGSGSGLHEAPPIVHEVLASPGQPLDPAARAFFEPRFGHDFGRVRVHADSRAAASARSVNAIAYTVGRDVVFNSGQYSTRPSPTQKHLLAHELAHVVQQHASAPMLSRKTGAAETDYSGVLQTLENPDPATALSRAVAALESVREGEVNQYFVDVDGCPIELNEFQFQNWMGNVRAALSSAPRGLRARLVEIEGLYARTLEVNAKYSRIGSAMASLGGVTGQLLYQAASRYYGTEKPGDALTQAFAAATQALDEADAALADKAYGRMLDSLARGETAIDEASLLVNDYREELGAQAESAAQAATTVRHVSLGVLIGLGSVIAAPVLTPAVTGGAVLGGGATIIGGASAGALVEGHVNLGAQFIRGEPVDPGELRGATWKGAVIGGPAAAGGVVGLGTSSLLGEATTYAGAVGRGGVTGFGSGSASSGLQALMEGKSAGETVSTTLLGGVEGSVGGMFGGAGGRLGMAEGIRRRLLITGLADASGNVLGGALVGKSGDELLLSAGLGVTTGTAMEFGHVDAGIKSVESRVQAEMTQGTTKPTTRQAEHTRLLGAYFELVKGSSKLPPDFDLSRFHDTLVRAFYVLGSEENLAAAAGQLEESRRLDPRGSKGRTTGEVYSDAAKQLFRDLNRNPQQGFMEIRWVPDSAPSGQVSLTQGQLQLSYEGATINVQPAPAGAVDNGTIVIVGPGGVKEGFRARNGFVDPQVFAEKIVEPGLPFFDYGALQLTATGQHGAITHMIQEVALINAGIDVVQFRKDLATIQRAFPDFVEVNGGKVGLGIGLWNVTYDVDPATYGSPEHMWENAMKQTLGINDREL